MNKISDFIIRNIDNHPYDIARVVAEQFKISVQAVNKHIKKLILNDIVGTIGNTRGRKYFLIQKIYRFTYSITNTLSESDVWTNDISPHMSSKNNVRKIWNYGFCEMFNNAIEHSKGTDIKVIVAQDVIKTQIIIIDNGIGIFKNIQNKFNLSNEHESILELSKGKLTTDSTKHPGEGVFFTSRVFDKFFIMSDGIVFTHNNDSDYLFDNEYSKDIVNGTLVVLELNNDSSRELKDVFDKFIGEDYGFDKTIIPIELAKYGDENLVSRSQARRILNRVNLFKHVILDFNNVSQIGQAFADEIFRVFAQEHKNIKFEYINASDDVKKMISHVMVSNINNIQ